MSIPPAKAPATLMFLRGAALMAQPFDALASSSPASPFKSRIR